MTRRTWSLIVLLIIIVVLVFATNYINRGLPNVQKASNVGGVITEEQKAAIFNSTMATSSVTESQKADIIKSTMGASEVTEEQKEQILESLVN